VLGQFLDAMSTDDAATATALVVDDDASARIVQAVCAADRGQRHLWEAAVKKFGNSAHAIIAEPNRTALAQSRAAIKKVTVELSGDAAIAHHPDGYSIYLRKQAGRWKVELQRSLEEFDHEATEARKPSTNETIARKPGQPSAVVERQLRWGQIGKIEDALADDVEKEKFQTPEAVKMALMQRITASLPPTSRPVARSAAPER
jgi:hypothetical protein